MWTTFDSGSWVSPQIAAILSIVDENRFGSKALERLQEGCPIIARQQQVSNSRNDAISNEMLYQHYARGPSANHGRSSKAVSALVELLKEHGSDKDKETLNQIMAVQRSKKRKGCWMIEQMMANDLTKGEKLQLAGEQPFCKSPRLSMQSSGISRQRQCQICKRSRQSPNVSKFSRRKRVVAGRDTRSGRTNKQCIPRAYHYHLLAYMFFSKR